MPFRGILKNAVESVEGGLGAVVMGYDGIAIDEYIKDDADFDIQLLAVEYATLLKEVKRTVEVLRNGALEEISITTENSRVIMRTINEDFFIALALLSDGNYGKGRYLLRRDVPKLLEAL